MKGNRVPDVCSGCNKLAKQPQAYDEWNCKNFRTPSFYVAIETGAKCGTKKHKDAMKKKSK
jgi:hypothetical protein